MRPIVETYPNDPTACRATPGLLHPQEKFRSPSALSAFFTHLPVCVDVVGDIPEEVGKLTNLVDLDLSSNCLSGECNGGCPFRLDWMKTFFHFQGIVATK